MKFSAMIAAFLLPLIGSVVPAAEPEAIAEEGSAELTPQQVRDAVHLVMKREATAENADQRAAAIHDLSMLYLAIVRDNEIAEQSRLRLKAVVYRRLLNVKEDLQRNIRRHEENADAELPQFPTTFTLAEENQDARGGGTVRDYGETLAELIQHVISPDHWDVNGGPGSIVYYPNLKVLVVRASGEAHGRVGGLVGGLRRP